MIRRLAVPLLVAALCSAWSIDALAQTRALVLTSCPTAPEHRARSLLGLLIPELIAAGVDLAGTALSEATTAKIAHASFDSEPFAYYTLDETGEVSRSLDLGCLVLVRGAKPLRRGMRSWRSGRPRCSSPSRR